VADDLFRGLVELQDALKLAGTIVNAAQSHRSVAAALPRSGSARAAHVRTRRAPELAEAAVALLALVLPVILCRPATASEFLLYGTRAISLGGAYTALASGPDALSWNPAGLSYPARIAFGYSRGGFTDDSQETQKLLDGLRRVNPEDSFYWDNPGRTADVADQITQLGQKAARDYRQSSFTLAGDKWALGYTKFDQWVLNTVPDEQRIEAVPPSESNSIAGNQTAVDVYALELQRFTVALSFLTPQDPFTVGFALHYHRGGVRFLRTRVFDLLSDDPPKLMRAAADAPREDSTDWSCDLGLLIPTDRFRIGIVARNLLFNDFQVKDPPEGALGELGPGPQLRVGVAYVAGQNQLASVDLDVTNDRVLGGRRKTRSFSAGYERWLTSWLAVRSGTSYELSGDKNLFFALGTAVKLSFLSLEAGGRINRSGGFNEIVGGASVSF
jgi:F plasmid transfer operon protein TraF